MTYPLGAPGTPGPANPRAKGPLRRRMAERRIFGPPFRQGNQGVQFPLAARQAGAHPRWTPRIRQGHAFLPGWGQASQGVQFPLTIDEAGSRPRWPPRVPRGRCFLPGWGQAPRGTAFPGGLYYRQRRNWNHRWLQRSRLGHAFAPLPLPVPGGLPAYLDQAGARPRWHPRARGLAGRVFLPPMPQASQPRPWPMFVRQRSYMRLAGLALPGRMHAGRISWTQRLPGVQLGVLPLTAAGSMSMAAYLGRNAALHMTAAGQMSAGATRQAFAVLHMTASGQMTITEVTFKQAALPMHAAGTMTIAGSATRAARVSMTAAGRMTVSATVARYGTLHMTASARMGISGTAGRPGALPMHAAGTMHLAAGVTRTAALPLHAAGTMSLAGQSSVSLVLRAHGSMAVAGIITRPGQLAMSAAGSMQLGAWAGPPGHRILIQPGAVTSPEQVTDEGSYRQQAPLTGPDQVDVTEIEPGF